MSWAYTRLVGRSSFAVSADESETTGLIEIKVKKKKTVERK